MQLYQGLHMIDVPFEGTRQVNVWLFAGRRRLLVDTGVASSPGQIIIPLLGNLGLGPEDLHLIINLHAHADHIGGNGALLAASGERVEFGAHARDADAIEDHHILARQVYRLTDPEHVRTLLARCGPNVPVTYRYQGGEIVDLDGLTLHIVHAPGHTAGNLALYDPANRALLHGESVMGAPPRDEQGREVTLFGTDPLAYLQTLERLEALDFCLFLSSHRPPMDRDHGLDLIRESRAALERYLSHCRNALAQGAASVSALTEAVAQEGSYRPEPWLETQVASVLDAWIAEGIAVRRGDGSVAPT